MPGHHAQTLDPPTDSSASFERAQELSRSGAQSAKHDGSRPRCWGPAPACFTCTCSTAASRWPSISWAQPVMLPPRRIPVAQPEFEQRPGRSVRCISITTPTAFSKASSSTSKASGQQPRDGCRGQRLRTPPTPEHRPHGLHGRERRVAQRLPEDHVYRRPGEADDGDGVAVGQDRDPEAELPGAGPCWSGSQGRCRSGP